MISQHLPRWILASVSKHFSAQCSALPLHIEGNARITNPKDRLEFRLDGPYITEPSKNYFLIRVEINILVTTIVDEKDGHKYLRNTGIALTGFTDTISVYRYGNGVSDDNSFLGCLQLLSQDREKVVVSNFGLVEPTNNIYQSTVEGHYQMELNGD